MKEEKKDWATDAIRALDKMIEEMEEAEKYEDCPWEKDPMLLQLRELGLVVASSIVWPVQSRHEAEKADSQIRESVYRVRALGGPDAVLDIFKEMDDLADELAFAGCPLETLFEARGPWSPLNFGFPRDAL